MREASNTTKVTATGLHKSVASIVSLYLGVDDPLHLANQIVEEAAEHYEADISTLFRIEDENRLVLKGGVLLDQGQSLQRPTGTFYRLDWGAKDWNDPKLKRKGVTAGVAVLNQELAISSYQELCRFPARLGRWDRYIYPNGPEDPGTGFGCLHAVPLRLSDRGEPENIVVGVFKIERRRTQPVFNEAERAAFAVVATHLNQMLRISHQVEQLINTHTERVLCGAFLGRRKLEQFFRVLSRYATRRPEAHSKRSVLLKELADELPEAADWINAVIAEVPRALGYKPVRTRQRFFPVLRTLRVEPLVATAGPTTPSMVILSKLIERGLSNLAVSREARDTALRNVKRWFVAPPFAAYRAQLEWLVEEERWDVLLDSFHRVLPFGTGGRRGPVGIGTNRFNPFTLESSVQGHVEYLRERYPDEDLAVVLAYDVRVFHDLRGIYNPTLPNPLRGITSRHFSHLAAGVYAANGVRVWMAPEESTTYVSTPELSFAIRRLKAKGGLNISASHNHPDDNGGKFYGAHGGQEVPPSDQEMAQRVERVDKLASLPLAEARAAGLLEWIPPDVHEEYIALNVGQSLQPTARAARIVFTPLHGTGDTSVGEVLRRAGFHVYPVVEQSEPDGSFPAVPFRTPNPEVPQSMQAGVDLARKVDADVVMACDPDADRIGVCSKTGDGNYQFLTGNEIAVLVTHYRLDALRSQRRLSAVPLVIKTEVTTELLDAITKDFGGRIIGDLLVGFKYHVNVLEQLERTGTFRNFRGNLDDFVIAVEESHGVLVTPELRDKDAAGAAILVAELAALQRAQGRTLVDYLYQLYRRYGYHASLGRSIVISGAVGLDNIQTIQDVLRRRPPSSVAGLTVVRTVDHRDTGGVHGELLYDTDNVARDVLVFGLENGARVIVRPSGTEPKTKIYVEVPSHPLGESADADELRRTMADVDSAARLIADDFLRQMLAIIGVEIPDYALRISDLVPLDKRIEFAEHFLPGLEARVHRVASRQEPIEEVSRWIDASLRTYGQDARGLVADAVRMYVEHERKEAAGLSIEQARERMQCLDAITALFREDAG